MELIAAAVFVGGINSFFARSLYIELVLKNGARGVGLVANFMFYRLDSAIRTFIFNGTLIRQNKAEINLRL
jgi:hypothetical protein